MVIETVLEAPKVVLALLVFADIKGFAPVFFFMDRQHGSVHMGQALFVIVYSTIHNMECWVLLLQEVQPSPKVFYLLLSGHACHEVMTATHNEAGEDFCGIAVICGIYIKTPCNMLLLLVVFDISSECFELIRSVVMLQNNIPVRLGRVIVYMVKVLYSQGAFLFSFYAVSIRAVVVLARQYCNIDCINSLLHNYSVRR